MSFSPATGADMITPMVRHAVTNAGGAREVLGSAVSGGILEIVEEAEKRQPPTSIPRMNVYTLHIQYSVSMQ